MKNEARLTGTPSPASREFIELERARGSRDEQWKREYLCEWNEPENAVFKESKAMTNQQTETKNQAPNPLPKTLPVGTLAGYNGRSDYRATGEWAMHADGHSYQGPYIGIGSGERFACGNFEVSDIRWSSVPSPAKTVFAPGMRVRILESGVYGMPGATGEHITLGRRTSSGDGDGCAWEMVEYPGWWAWEKNIAPIEPEVAKPVEESDADWLRRTVREQTDVVGFSVRVYQDHSATIKHPQYSDCIFFGAQVRTRSVNAIRAQLAAYTWPLKDSAGVGSAGTAKGNQADLAPSGSDCAQPAQPTPAETYCAECPLPAMPGKLFCVACAARRKQAGLVIARQPCGDGCRCVYCRYAKGEGNLERSEIDRSYRYDTDNPKVGKQRLSLDAARKRLAALEARELRLNDPSRAEVKMLDGAQDALRHWPSVEDWEP